MFKKAVILTSSVVFMLMMLVSCGSKTFSKDDLTLTIKNIKIQCNKDVKPVLDKLGKDYTYSESTSCEYDGLDKIYKYKDFSIYTYPKGNQDYISEVSLNDAAYSTKKKIKVGMKKSDLVKAYGEKFFMAGQNLTYNVKNDSEDVKSPTLYFTLDENNEVITAIGVTADKSDAKQ